MRLAPLPPILRLALITLLQPALLLAPLALSGCDGEPQDSKDPVTDADNDGSPAGEDCDDNDRAIRPGADERCDGIDQDCDGEIDEQANDTAIFYADGDGDGYGLATDTTVACEAPAGYVSDRSDCDDARADIHPGADESDCTDPVDYNCDGSTQHADLDGDGAPACEDCNDTSFDVRPGADEHCDNRDEDCDGAVDEDPVDPRDWHPDADRDGYGDSAITVTACTAPSGHTLNATDCDDTAYARNPGATEVCDADDTDEDCDGLADDDDSDPDPDSLTAWYADRDGDGYGDPATLRSACEQPAATITQGGDCDDAAPAISPAAQEVCDSANTDEDCDGFSDDADVTVLTSSRAVWHRDYDSDGWGSDAITVTRCDAPGGYVAPGGDCLDSNFLANPGGAEFCDLDDIDEDCDGYADDADPDLPDSDKIPMFADTDGDGYGDISSTVYACDAGSGAATMAGDCDEADPAINPGAAEICDPYDTDEDCDGLADDTDPSTTDIQTWYLDSDRDGYGGASSGIASCDAIPGRTTTGGDCDDALVGVNPAATETCDARDTDEDCDGLADDNDPSTADLRSAWRDSDGDGYGAGAAARTCEIGNGYATNDTDCDDTAAAINPAAPESCAAGDEDCDGLDGDADPSVADQPGWSLDNDGDGYGDDATAIRSCSTVPGRVSAGGDCDDRDTAFSPGAAEVCGDGRDQDCSGRIDDCGMIGSRSLSTADLRLPGASASSMAGMSVLIVGDDALIGAPGSNAAYDPALSPGAVGDLPLSGAPAWTGSGAAGSALAAADLDGDSLPDLIVGAPSLSAIYLVSDLSAASPGALSSPIASSASLGVGRALAAVDGALAVGAPSGAGAAWLFVEPPAPGTPLDAQADASFQSGTSGDLAGTAVALVDLDGDSAPDLIAGAPGAVFSLGAVYAFYDPAGSLGTGDADLSMIGAGFGDGLGGALAPAGDVNGDGYEDLFAGAPAAARAYVLPGGRSGALTAASALLTFNGTAGTRAGAAFAGGDFDGDGHADIAVGAPLDAGGEGAVYTFYGPLSGAIAPASAAGTFTGTGEAGAALSSGDLDADGLDDLLIGGPSSDGAVAGSGAAWLLYGAE